MKNVFVSLWTVTCCIISTPAWSAPTHITPSLQQGEFLRFEAKVGEVKGGYCYIKAERVRKTRKGLRIRASLKARTNLFFDKIHRINNRFSSTFGLYNRSGFDYKINVDQGGTLLKRKVKFSHRGRKGHLRLNAHYKQYRGKPFNRTYRSERIAPSDTHNLVSALYRARFLRYRKGRTFSFHVFSTGRLWSVKGKMKRITTVYTILGAQKAYEIHAVAKRAYPNAKPRQIRVWLSADRRRIPFKVQGYVPFIGTAAIELIGYRRSRKSRYIDASSRRKKRKGNRVWNLLSQY